jgi:glioma pathogenesis-related protein 2
MKEALKEHNEIRKKHGASPLVLNLDLIKHADKQAREIASSALFVKSNNSMENKKLGENIMMSMKGALNGREVTALWYDESKLHNFKNNSHQKLSENFSQMVWKGTKEVGFGLAKGKRGQYIVVANYFPAGNTPKEFEQNVYPAASS